MRFTIGRANIGAVLALGALLVAPPLLAQQTAAVQGTVTDGASGAPISGAVVAVVGTTFQGVTNVLGNYRIAGVPAGAITIRVRGASSISLSNEPLVYIDGIRVNSQGAPQFFTGGQSYERLNDLEPGDIESVELVKGPAAATLYGADASPGVIQIITKRGRPGTGKFTQSVNFDYNSIDRNFTPRTNYGRCTAAQVADTNRALCFGQPVGTLVSDNPLLRQNAFRTGQMVGVNWSGRGGGQNYGYYTSLNRENEDGVLPNNGFNRSFGRVNFYWVRSQNLTLDAGVGVTVSLADLPDNDNNIFGWLGNSHLGSPLTRTVNGLGQDGWFGVQRDVAAMKAINNQRQSHRSIASFTANFAARPNFTHRLTAGLRSEEHTSELQSLAYLVCRLLLE